MREWLLPWISFPLFSIGLTLVAFCIGLWVYRRTGRVWLQPLVVALLLVVAALWALDLDYATYRAATEPFVLLLGPATLALMVPLYRQLRRLRELLWPILITLLCGGVLGLVLTLGIAWLLGASWPVQVSLAPKSTTMPIAVLIAEETGGVTALTAVFVMITGVLGAVLGPWLLDRAGVQDPVARGLSYGINAHAIGTSRALEEGEECAAFSAVGMSLLGMLLALTLPWWF